MNSSALDIRDVAYGGRGVGRLADGCVVFVPGTLPGEQVVVETVNRRKSFAEARLVDVVTPSAQRIAPACPLAGYCPGCCYQHASYEEEVRMKQAQFAGLLKRLAGIDPAVCLPPRPSPISLHYRNKLVLHAAGEGDCRTLGYFAEDNMSVLEVTRCPLAVEPLNLHLEELRNRAEFLAGLQPPVRLTLRWTDADGAMDWQRRIPDGAADPRTWLTESTALGPLRVPRGGFFQVNAAAAKILLESVSAKIREIAPRCLVDLYCGVGLFGIAGALAGVPSVYGADTDEIAIQAARANAEARSLKQARFAAYPAERGLAALPDEAAGERALLIVDPPRAGLFKAVLRGIAERRFGDILYVSCAADTLARDLKLLGQAGYGVASSQLVDMFPRTPYFESVTHLALTGRGGRT